MHRIELFFLLLAVTTTLVACELGEDQSPATSADTAATEVALLPILQNGQWGYIDTMGTIVVQPQFNRAFPFSENLALVEADSGFGYIRTDGAYSIPPQFEDAWHFFDGRAPVQSAGSWHFIDEQGNAIDPGTDIAEGPDFDLQPGALVEADYQPRQFQLIHSGGRYGFQSRDGDVVIDPRFNNAWYFSDGLARVMMDSLWGYIDRDGDVVIEPAYDLAWEFENGVALVMIDGKYGYIDRDGKFIWEPTD